MWPKGYIAGLHCEVHLISDVYTLEYNSFWVKHIDGSIPSLAGFQPSLMNTSSNGNAPGTTINNGSGMLIVWNVFTFSTVSPDWGFSKLSNSAQLKFECHVLYVHLGIVNYVTLHSVAGLGSNTFTPTMGPSFTSLLSGTFLSDISTQLYVYFASDKIVSQRVHSQVIQ
jgi:hypothetical protein